MAEPSQATVYNLKNDEYRSLVEKATKGECMASAFMNELELSTYGPTADVGNLVAVFRALYPEDYELWLEKEAEGEG